jgi:hypothetical protein
MPTARTKRLITSLTAVGMQARYELEPATLEDGERRVAARALRWAKDLYVGKRGVDGLAAHEAVRDAIRTLEGKD